MAKTTKAEMLADSVEDMTDRISTKPLPWWLSLFTVILLIALVLILWWVGNTLQQIIRQNTEALTRSSINAERMERFLLARERP